MKVRYVPYHPDHGRLMHFGESTFSIEERLNEISKDPANFVFTVLKGDLPVAAMAAVQIFPKSLEISAAICEDSRCFFATIHRSAMELIERVQKGTKAHRLQMTVKCDFEKANRWVDALGFEKECKLERYGPEGEDYWLYRRLY